MASKYTFTVRLTSDEDDILMMEGRGDFAARKKKKTLTDNHTNIIQQPYITLHTKNKTKHNNLTLLALRDQLV